MVSGHPVHEVSWLHDGKPILRDNRIEVRDAECDCAFSWFDRFVSLLFRSLFQLLSDPPRLFIKKVQKEDQGMYQCFVSNEWEQVQSTSELQLGGK